MTFADDLHKARAERLPRMALRPLAPGSPLMDDIVIRDVTLVHLEQMDHAVWWMGCDFANGGRVTFHLRARSRPLRLEVQVGEQPSEWEDLDARRGPE